jgi:hypothetical protein
MYSCEYVIDRFTEEYLKDCPQHGDDWLEAVGNYLDGTKFPSDRITLNIFTSHPNRFTLTYHFEGNNIGHSEIEVRRYGVMSVIHTKFKDDSFNIFSHFITDYFRKYNADMFEAMKTEANVTDEGNKVEVEDCTDHKPNGKRETLKGTLEEIFDRYTAHNDRLRYCNGMYWRFSDSRTSTLYHMFTEMYEGNYFLTNAVGRGVTID